MKREQAPTCSDCIDMTDGKTDREKNLLSVGSVRPSKIVAKPGNHKMLELKYAKENVICFSFVLEGQGNQSFE